MAKRSGYSQFYFAKRRALAKQGLPYSSRFAVLPKVRLARKRPPKKPAPTMVSVDGINGKVPSNLRKGTLDRIRNLPASQHAAAITQLIASQQRATAFRNRRDRTGERTFASELLAKPAANNSLNNVLKGTNDKNIGMVAATYLANKRKQDKVGLNTDKSVTNYTNVINMFNAYNNPDDNPDNAPKFIRGENEMLKSLWRDQNYTEPQTLVNDSTFERLAKSGDFHVVYRGVSESGHRVTKKAVDFARQLQTGEYFAGSIALYGHGTYTSPRLSLAMSYANLDESNPDKGGAVSKTLIPKDARLSTTSQLKAQMTDYKKQAMQDLTAHYDAALKSNDPKVVNQAENAFNRDERLLGSICSDTGYFATMRGYDAYQVDDSKNGKDDHWVILNRGNTISSKRLLTRYDEK